MPKAKADEVELRERIRCLAHENRRYGCMRITALLRREDIHVNKKRVHRIWKEEGLGLKSKRPKRRQYGPKGEVKKKAQCPNDVWSWDFMHDRTENGRQIKMLTGVRGMPKHLRSDNGGEFIADIIREWLAEIECDTIYIEPGSPWENP